MKRRSVRPLFASWIAYWAIIGLVKLGPAALAIWRATRSTESNTSSVTVNMSNLALKLVVTDHGRITWSGESHISVIAAWIAIVPIAMTVVWFMRAKADAGPVSQSV